VLPDRFSISKWIHLNGGDDALTSFFRRVHFVLNQGGTFVLEPQAWDTYAKAKRMDAVRQLPSVIREELALIPSAQQKLKENAKSLGIRPDDFESLLRGMGFGRAQHLGATGEGGARGFPFRSQCHSNSKTLSGFRRPVDLYIKL
jgi:7SK snRNA methylphosphate capping enzyme